MTLDKFWAFLLPFLTEAEDWRCICEGPCTQETIQMKATEQHFVFYIFNRIMKYFGLF